MARLLVMEQQRIKRRRIVVDDSALANRIGDRIRQARRQARLTQQQLAEGRYTKAYISALEKGHAKPSMAALNFISERLGLPASHFLADASGTWDRLATDIALASGDWSAAAKGYEALLGTAIERGLRAEIMLGLAHADCRLERGGRAIPPATAALEIFTALGRREEAALATYWLACAHVHADDRAEARTLLVGLLADLRTLPHQDNALRLRALKLLGVVEERDGQLDQALARFEEATALAGHLELRNRAVFLRAVAEASQAAGDTEGAVRAGRESLTLYRAADDRYEAALLENRLARAYLSTGDLPRAKAVATRARTRHAHEGDDRALAHVVETQARIAIAEGQSAEAVELGNESRALAQRTANPRVASLAMLTIARAQAGAGEIEAAIRSYETSVSEFRSRGPASRLQQSLGEWAELLATAGRHEEAYELTREALKAAEPPVPPPAAARRPRALRSTAASTAVASADHRSRTKARVS